MMPASLRPTAPPTLDQLLHRLVTPPVLSALVPTGLTLDSRDVVPGGLFLACAGTAHHGMDFIEQAVACGAAVVLAEPTAEWSSERLKVTGEQFGLSIIAVPRLAKLASEIGARFYHHPSDELAVIGITGTNGKTSVSHFLAAALDDGKRRCGVLGTLGYGLPGALQPASHTTPDPLRVQAVLADLYAQGADSVAMEVSSHALHQHRVAGVAFHTAVFTNLSRDHLDYHGDMARYGEVKAKLFERTGLQLAVINRDDAFGRDLIARSLGHVRVIACGVEHDAPAGTEAVSASAITGHADGLAFTLHIDDTRLPVRCGLLGRFTIDNLLLVAGVLHGWGLAPVDIARRLAGLTTVPGRMQRFGGAGQPAVVVDYAHTPDALEQALRALRPHVRGQLCCVFGCGGDRDTGKRPLMGAVAEQLADRVIITDDNPRSEDGARIVQQILAGMAQPRQALIERNRAKAIASAIAGAGEDDLVLVAGKGHEDYQQIGELRLPFSDVIEVQRALGGEA